MPLILHWQDAELADAALQAFDWGEESPLVANWVDQQGASLGAAFEIDPPKAELRETTDGAGNFIIQPSARPVTLHGDAPQGAKALLLRRGERRLARFDLSSLYAVATAREPDERHFVPDGSPQTKIWVVSECFADAQAGEFFAQVASLREYWLEHFLPFQNPQVAARLTFEGLFWASNQRGGNFATSFPTNTNDRIVKGNDDLLADFLREAGVPLNSRPFVLVLINSSSVRGGAGGNVFHNQFAWQAAWVTNHSNVAEDWRSIALHELGHSFGLMDEYEASYSYPRQEFEPNVSPVTAGPALPQPWRAMLTVSPSPAGYVPLVNGGAQKIAQFLGARYTRDEYYRPSPTCLMRSIGPTESPVDLCPVCAEIIARKL